MLLETQAGPWKKLAATNFTPASFAALKSTATKPSGAGVVDLLGDQPGSLAQNAALLRFFGTDTNNQNFNVRVWGWAFEATGSWENCLLAQFAVTLGNLAGVSGCAITATDFEADTIALTYGSTGDTSINSNAADVRGAYARVDLQGFGLWQVQFDMNSSAVSANALYRMF